jgi:predicted negative regulator of RcsB-dependent stress response
MSAYDLEEQERISALKDWWDRWGTWVYLAVTAFFIGVIGTYFWRDYQVKQAMQADALFKSVKKTAEEVNASKEFKKLSEAANALTEKFPRSFQATDAQLMAAKSAFDAKDLAAAKTHLQWVVDKGRDTHRNIARVQLASVLLEDKKYDDALKTLDGVKEDAFVGVAADLRGDIFAVQGKRDEARAAYQVAVERAGDRSPLKAISQAKLDAFGGAVVVAGAPDKSALDKNTNAKPAEDKGVKK